MAEHHRASCNLLDDRQVVRDEQARESQLGLQTGQEFEHLGLHRHVECTGGLIGDHQSGVQGQGTGNGNPLTLPTAHLMWVPIRHRFGQFDLLQQVTHPGSPPHRVKLGMQHQGFGD